MELERYLRRQAGVISRAQAIAAGLSRHTVHRAIKAGKWHVLHPRVYLAADHEYTDEARLRGAVLWAGAEAVVHGVSAAWWDGLWTHLPERVEVTVPRRREPGRQPGVALRRRDLANADLVLVRDVWITALPLTAIEAAVALGAEGSTLLDRALQRRVGFDAVHRAHCRNLGRRGSTAASALLVAAADRAASHAERLLVKLLRDAGITGWKVGYRWMDYVIDLAFPHERIAVEVDGWAWHMTPERFVRDRQRQNAVANGRWHVLRFSWHVLTARPADVVAEIRTALSQR